MSLSGSGWARRLTTSASAAASLGSLTFLRLPGSMHSKRLPLEFREELEAE